jgi:hypothetical protein
MTTRSTLRRSIFLASLMTALCLGAAGQEDLLKPADPGQPKGTTKAHLELRFSKGDTDRYKFNQTAFVVVKGVQGSGVPSAEPFEIQAKGVMFEKLIGVTDDGDYEVKAGFERANILQGDRALSFGAEDLPHATVILGKLGNTVATKEAYPGIPIIANQPWSSQARPPSSWIVLPSGDATKGLKWTQDVPVATVGVEGEALKAKVSYELEGFEEMMGSDCARIMMSSTGPIQAKGVTVYGMPVDVTLDFSVTATAWVRVSDGRLVRMDESARQSLVGTPAAQDEGETPSQAGQAGQIEVGIDSSVTVELIPPNS